MPDPQPTEAPARPDGQELMLRDQREDITACPSCGRESRTLGRGTCAECWQAKTPDGQPAVQSTAPKTLRLLEPADIPTWVWAAPASAVLAVLIAALIYAF